MCILLYLLVINATQGTVEPFREDVAANKRAWRAVEGNEMPKWDEQWLNLNYLDSNEDDNGPGVSQWAALALVVSIAVYLIGVARFNSDALLVLFNACESERK